MNIDQRKTMLQLEKDTLIDMVNNLGKKVEDLESQLKRTWISVNDQMPEPGVPVIALVAPNEHGQQRRIRAMWAPANTLELAPGAEGGVYDEATDTFYCEEGWYETNEYEEVHWDVSGTVTHWQKLPPLPDHEKE